MRYGDMVALLVKVHEEYRAREEERGRENEKNEKEREEREVADVSMGQFPRFPDE